MSALKQTQNKPIPCPFCGSELEHTTRRRGIDSDTWEHPKGVACPLSEVALGDPFFICDSTSDLNLWNARATPPAKDPAKGLFIELIEQHPGLAEELKAMDAVQPTALNGDDFELRGSLAHLKCWHRLTEEEATDLVRFAVARTSPMQIAVTEEMHIAAVKVLHRANGVDGLPQRMLDAMLAVQATPPAAKEAPEQTPEIKEFEAVMLSLERVWHRLGQLWERCQGKGWPKAESDEFLTLRDEAAPQKRAALIALAGLPEKSTSGYAKKIEALLKQRDSIKNAASILQEACHGAASTAGWWIDPKTGESITGNPYCFSNKLMLVVSEVSEAMEGDRKGLMDDKLAHRPMREVELADAVIRIFDLAGAYGMDLGGAIEEKMAFNAQRPDHKIENRSAVGGKAY